jgi:hypothetical protein
MRTVEVKLRTAVVTKFLPREATIEFAVVFTEDGIEQRLVQSSAMDQPMELAQQILAAIRKQAKVKRSSRSFDDDPLAGIVTVKLHDDDDVVIEKLGRFFAQIRERIHSSKMQKVSYYDMEKRIRGLSVEF